MTEAYAYRVFRACPSADGAGPKQPYQVKFGQAWEQIAAVAPSSEPVTATILIPAISITLTTLLTSL